MADAVSRPPSSYRQGALGAGPSAPLVAEGSLGLRAASARSSVKGSARSARRAQSLAQLQPPDPVSFGLGSESLSFKPERAPLSGLTGQRMLALQLANDVAPFLAKQMEGILEKQVDDFEKQLTLAMRNLLDGLQQENQQSLRSIAEQNTTLQQLQNGTDMVQETLDRLIQMNEAESRNIKEVMRDQHQGEETHGFDTSMERANIDSHTQDKAVDDKDAGKMDEESSHARTTMAPLASVAEQKRFEENRILRGFAQRSLLRTYCQFIVEHPLFQSVCTGVIMLNSVCMALGTEWSAMALLSGGQVGAIGVLTTIDNLCFAWYCLELLLKLAYLRVLFWTGLDRQWNLFDLMLIVISVYGKLEEALTSGLSGADFAWMRMFRLIKVLKVLRVVRVLRAFRDLRVIVQAVYDALAMTFWSTIVLMCTMFVFSMFFMQGFASASDLLLADENVHMLVVWSMRFGSLDRCMALLFSCVTGGSLWLEIAQDIRDTMGIAYYVVFLVYICFTNFSMLNIILGIGVDGAMRIATKDYEQVIHEMIEKNEAITGAFKKLFKDMNVEGEDTIRFKDFMKVKFDPDVLAFFSALEIDVLDAERLFMMLAKGEGNEAKVHIEELVAGCMRLKGHAKSIDAVCLQALAVRNQKVTQHFMDFVEEELQHLDSAISHMFKSLGVRPESRREKRTLDERLGPELRQKVSFDGYVTAATVQLLPTPPA